MIRRFPILMILLSICFGSLSQNRTENFEITLPDRKVENSLYNEIGFIDSRYDITNLGIVQLGAFNKKAKVIPQRPFTEQLTNVLHSLTTDSSADGKLLLQLRQFNFAEITGAMSEKGYCYLRAQLYSKAGKHYQEISSIDTVIFIKALDVTKALFRKGSEAITDFIAANLIKKPDSISIFYSLADINKIDSIEKRKMLLYNVSSFSDGLYLTFESFANQIPDRKEMVEMKNENIIGIRVQGASGKPEKIKAKNVYAIVHNGRPFIATEYGYYPLQKRDGDFYFTGKAKVTANTGDVIAANVFFGILGGLIASNADATFEMKIDHLNGGFIRLREIKALSE